MSDIEEQCLQTATDIWNAVNIAIKSKAYFKDSMRDKVARSLCAVFGAREAGLEARAVAAEKERDELRGELQQAANNAETLVTEIYAERNKVQAAERKRDHSVQWYAERFEPLKTWARSNILSPEQRDQFFCIIANAQPTVCGSKPPELAVQLNMMRHAKEAAERRAERAEAALKEMLTATRADDDAREALDAKEGE